jgi:aryl-alcohol dehydrogenase-like predicted oxidoreductase
MRYRHLGSTGVRVSEISLGTGGQFGGRVDQAAVKRIVAAALDAGINYVDTANIYGDGHSEEYLGPALAGIRHEIVLGSKGMQVTGPGQNEWGASRYNLMNALEASLRRLRTDHLDLYQIHLYDASTPMEETMRTLDDMVRSGKVLYVGASQYQAWQVCRGNDIAERFGWVRFATNQVHYHLLERECERELVPFCRATGVGILAFFPLAAGLLAGRYRLGQPFPEDSRAAVFDRTRRYLERYGTPANYAIIDRLSVWATERGHTLSELAIAWLLTEHCVSSVVVGASKPEHVTANAAASDWRLTADEAAEVREIVEGGVAK